MKEYRIILEPQFKEELNSILYLFPHFNITRKKLHTEIRNTVLSLEIFPERYNKIVETQNIKEENIRKLPINKFIVVYQVDNENNQVNILHIFSERQDYLNQI